LRARINEDTFEKKLEPGGDSEAVLLDTAGKETSARWDRIYISHSTGGMLADIIVQHM
jgi:hypothetical protein